MRLLLLLQERRCLRLRRERVDNALLWERRWYSWRLWRLQRLIRAMLPFRRSRRRRRLADVLLNGTSGRFHVATLAVTVGRHLFGAEGHADAAAAGMVYLALGSNNSAQGRRRFRRRCWCHRVRRLFSIRCRVFWLNFLVFLHRRQRGNRRIVDDASLVPVAFFLLVFYVEDLDRFLGGSRLRRKRWWHRSRKRFIGFFNNNLNDRFGFCRIVA